MRVEVDRDCLNLKWKIMKFTNILASLACVAQLVAAQVQWPVHNNSLNTVVEWDHYSYIIKGQRLFIWSGEVRTLFSRFGGVEVDRIPAL